MLDIITALAAPLSAVIVAIIEWRAYQDRDIAKKAKEEEARKQQKRQEEDRLRQEQREEESRLSMKMMSATMQLSIVLANAVTGGHNNGNVEVAKQEAAEAVAAYNSFLQRVAAHNIT